MSVNCEKYNISSSNFMVMIKYPRVVLVSDLECKTCKSVYSWWVTSFPQDLLKNFCYHLATSKELLKFLNLLQVNWKSLVLVRIWNLNLPLPCPLIPPKLFMIHQLLKPIRQMSISLSLFLNFSLRHYWFSLQRIKKLELPTLPPPPKLCVWLCLNL